MEYIPELNNLGNLFTVDMVPDGENEASFDGQKDIIDLFK